MKFELSWVASQVLAVLVVVSIPVLAVGPRQQRQAKPIIKQIPVTLVASANVVIKCPKGIQCAPYPQILTLTPLAKNPNAGTLAFTYQVTGGKLITSETPVKWDLTSAAPGKYAARVKVTDEKGGVGRAEFIVTVAECTACDPPPPPCPVIEVSCPQEFTKGNQIIFSAAVKAEGKWAPTFKWTINKGRIVVGQSSAAIQVDTKDLDEDIKATVEVGGADPSCIANASCTTKIKRP